MVKTMEIYRITTNYCCFAVEVEDGFVVNAAPISKWAIGKPWDVVRDWWIVKRDATIELVL
jgi:hypothetical protein